MLPRGGGDLRAAAEPGAHRGRRAAHPAVPECGGRRVTTCPRAGVGRTMFQLPSVSQSYSFFVDYNEGESHALTKKLYAFALTTKSGLGTRPRPRGLSIRWQLPGAQLPMRAGEDRTDPRVAESAWRRELATFGW